MTVLMLQAFTGKRRPTRSTANQKSACLQITASPDKVTNPLETEH